MNRFSISIIMCLVAITVVAQNNTVPVVQMMEGEIRAGLTTPLGGYHSGKAQISGVLGIEGRYNFRGTPWNCGLMIELSTARRGYEHLYNDGYERWQNNRTLALATTGEYNFRQGTIINPFVGTALGLLSMMLWVINTFRAKELRCFLLHGSALNFCITFVS